jgi:hypothetical protein
MLKIGTIVPAADQSEYPQGLRGIGVISKGLMISLTARIHTPYSSEPKQNPKNSSTR